MRSLLTLVLGALSFGLMAQSPGESYISKATFYWNSIGNKEYQIPAGARINVLQVTGDTVVFMIYPYGEKARKKAQSGHGLTEARAADLQNIHSERFKMDKLQFSLRFAVYTEKYIVDVGAFTFPYKGRFPASGMPFAFESSFSLSPSIFLATRADLYKPNYIGAYLSVGLNSVRYFHEADTARSTTDVTAFYFSGGLMYQTDKFQIAAGIGWDYINNNDVMKWPYQGKPWFTVSIGVSLFRTTQSDPSN